MSGKTAPWWRKAVQFVWKNIRVAVRIDARSTGARGQAASSEPAFEEPVVGKINTGTSLELQVEEETALNQESPEELESAQKLPERAPMPDREVTPDPGHDDPGHDQTASAAHAEGASNEAGQQQATPQDPEEVPETPADLLAEAALGNPAEGDPEAVPEPKLESQLSAEEPEAPVTGNIEESAETETAAEPEVVEAIAEVTAEQESSEPEVDSGAVANESHAEAGADVEAPEVEATEAAFGQPIDTAPEEAAETALVEEAVAEVPTYSPEAPEASAGGGEQQGSEGAAADGSAAEIESPGLPAQAATAPPQVAQVAAQNVPVKREEGPDTSPFSVLVSQVYEGPLDLLLDLIRKQDIDIYDIPIAKITAQFLAYVNQLKASDMDVAGEFIYTASLLIHIKSKMLLPRAPAGPDDVQEDPRRELVEKLLEHERFKNAAQMLQQKQMLESATWTNPGMREFRDDANADAEIAADTTDLVRIFREILERARNRPILDVQEDSVTVGQMIQFLTRRLTMEDKPVALRRLLSHTHSERALIAMFLALLELVRLQAILLRQDRQFSEILIKKNSGFDAFVNQGAARDDWQ
jgi:segregation and condensation protein A